MDFASTITYFFITVTAVFSEAPTPYYTYNQSIYFLTAPQCERYLERMRMPVEESFQEFWKGPGRELMENYTLETWNISCVEWYRAWDNEFYPVGIEPEVTT